ncbi:MAG: hypothetical protein HXN95_03740 [Prevotella salivae]|nr:hypothetical protein [Segatella salivae]
MDLLSDLEAHCEEHNSRSHPYQRIVLLYQSLLLASEPYFDYLLCILFLMLLLSFLEHIEQKI